MKRADHQIVQQVLDGTVTKDSFDGFQQRLRDEPELVKLYGDYAHLHHSLCEEFEDQAITKSPVLTSSRTRGAKFLWFAVAAAVALVAVMIYPKPKMAATPAALLAKVEFSPDAVWLVEGVSRTISNTVELGEGSTLKLEQGQAAVRSAHSVAALIDGPSVLTLVSDKALHLASGKVRFKVGEAGAGIEVTTPSMSALDMGTEFGIEVRAEQPDELHVFDGKVTMRVNGSMDKEVLIGGEAGRVVGKDQIEKFPANDHQFLKEPRSFKSIVEGRFVNKDWRLDYGSPTISEDRIEGQNYSLFLPLTQPQPMADGAVLMATLKVNRPANGEFHTDGWAGMSFFSQGKEVLFFGDSFGPETTWSLDVKQRIPVILPVTPLVGPHTVTLRYDRGTGAVSLHDGGIPLRKSFCGGRIPVGLSFDEIRLGASSGAALDVSSLTIRVSE
jgi:hypothetical protein